MSESELRADETRSSVREHYAKVSAWNAGCAPGCCATMGALRIVLATRAANAVATTVFMARLPGKAPD